MNVRSADCPDKLRARTYCDTFQKGMQVRCACACGKLTVELRCVNGNERDMLKQCDKSGRARSSQEQLVVAAVTAIADDAGDQRRFLPKGVPCPAVFPPSSMT